MNNTNDGDGSGGNEQLIADHILQRLGAAGLPPEVGVRKINVGNDSYLRVLEHEYFGRHLKHGASFKLVQGYFGGGKTHFLHCVRELAWEHGFATAVVELSPTECPYDDPLKVYRAVAKRIMLAPERPLEAWSLGLPDLLRNIVDDRLDAAIDGGLAEDAARSEVRRWLTRTVGRAACESHSFRQAVVRFSTSYLDEDLESEARIAAWLLGESLPVGEVREYGIYESTSRANGFEMLRALTQMVVALGVAGTALLFDEVDRNLSVSAKRSQVIGDNLRQVIDLCGRQQLPKTLFLYAVPPEFMRTVVPDYPALAQRLRSPVPLSVRSPQSVLIDLEHLDLEPTELLARIGGKITKVFETARGCNLDPTNQESNARRLAAACAESHFEVNHRRLFVKAWVDFLFQQLVDGEILLDDSTARGLVSDGSAALQTPVDDFDDF